MLAGGKGCAPAGVRHLSWLSRLLFGPERVQSAAPVGGHGLLDPAEASGLSVYRIPGLLDEREVQRVLQTSAEIVSAGAGLKRLQSSPAGEEPSGDHQGYEVERGDWQTCYLHTMHMFQRRLPELHAKLKEAALAVDSKEWGLCRRALEASPGHQLATRCVELHMVGATGAALSLV